MTELRRQLLQSWVDAGNSSEIELVAGASFQGTTIDLTDVATILVSIYADVESAPNGIEFVFSHDGVTWITTDTYTHPGGTVKTYTIQPVFPYFRVQYANNATTPQGDFRLVTTLLTGSPKSSSHRLADDLSTQDDAELVKAVLAAEIPNDNVKNVRATALGALNVHITEENQDAFGRVRTSDPVSLLDSTFAYNLNPRQFEQLISGNGVIAYDVNRRSAKLSVTAGAAGVAGLQSYQYAHYNPGKSHLIFVTEASDPNDNGYASGQKYEIGYFDDFNGLFARRDDAGAYAVKRSSTSGSVVDEVVPTADFNIDPLDGTGPSGLTLNPGKSQIIVIDLQFLGVGRVRMGLEVAGTLVYAHEFNFANEEAGMYMQSGTLPVRWLLTDTGTTGFDFAEAYCCMVTSEGGTEENRGIPLVAGSGAVGVGTTEIPIISIRAGLTFNGIVNRIWNILEAVRMMNTGTNEVIARIWYDPTTLTGASFAAVDASDSGMEVDVAASAITPGSGIKIDEFYVPASATTKGEVEAEIKSRLPIALDRAGTGRVGTITLTAQAVTGTTTVYGAIKWREVR